MKIINLLIGILTLSILATSAIASGFITYVHYDEVKEKEREPVDIYYKVYNDQDTKLEGLNVKVTMPELGEHQVSQGFDLRSDDYYSGYMYFDMYDQDIESGEYIIKYTVSNDDYKRTKYRFIYIE